MAGVSVEVTGLTPLVRELKGPLFKDVNKELRQHARKIATDLVPHVADAVRQSGAPQAAAMAETVRAHSDRVPVVAVGKVNPKFRSSKFSRKGGDSKLRRGSLAHGVVYGPLGGKRSTAVHENYYRIGRDNSGGALGESTETGTVYDRAVELYLDGFLDIMKRHGFVGMPGRVMRWRGGNL